MECAWDIKCENINLPTCQMSRSGLRDSTASLCTMSQLARQKSVLHIVQAPDPRSQNKEKILVVLTRLNDKATQRGAADDLAAIVRNLDADSMSVLVNNICNTGAWEPKPFAKKEGIHALGLLFNDTCPVRDLALQQYLGKLLAHIKKCMQDTDGPVRDACSDALVAVARAMSEQTGTLLPGSVSCPVVKVLFDGLSEQKRESQQAAAQALLQMSPVLAPLSKDLVKTLLRMLKSSTFQGTAALLAAIASTSPDSHQPAGLLKDGTWAFLPYLAHVIGQPATGSSTGSGILGCLSHKDWAVRKAAGDTLKAAVMVLGPQLEPEGCWDVDSPASLTGRCLQGLEGAKFDKVREARDVTRDAAVAVAELQRYVAEGGQQGGWESHCAHITGASAAAPGAAHILAPLTITPVTNPSPGKLSGRLSPGRSPVSETFRRAAASGEVMIAEPKPRPRSAMPPAVDEDGDGGVGHEGEGGLIAAVRSSSNGGAVDGRSAIRPSSRSNSSRSNSSRRRTTAEQPAAAADQAAAMAAETQNEAWPAGGSAGGAAEVAETAGPVPAFEASASQVEPQWSVQGQRVVSAGGEATHEEQQGQHEEGGALEADQQQSSTSDAEAAADAAVGDWGQDITLGPSASTAPQPALRLDTMDEPNSSQQLQPLPSMSPRRRSISKQQQQQQGEQGAAPSSSARDSSNAPLRVSSGGRPSSAHVRSSSGKSWGGAGADASGPSLLVPKAEWDATRRQLAELRQGHELLAALLQELRHSSAASIAALQDRVALLESQLMRRSSHLTPRPEPRSRLSDTFSGANTAAAPQPQARSTTDAPATAAAAAGAAAVAAALSAGPSGADVSAAAAAEGGSRTMPGMTRSMDWTDSMRARMGLANGSTGMGVSSSLSALPSRVPDSSNSMYAPGANAATPGAPTAGPVTPGTASTPNAATPTAGATPSAAATPGSLAPGDLEAAFVDALHHPKGDMQLLRLIQKTGPVWGQLSTPTALELLEAFTKSVRQGVMLHRILPWLWRLGDEGAGGPAVPVELQRALVDALASSPGIEDEQVQEKVQLLVDTLRAVWSLPAGNTTTGMAQL